MSSLGRHVRKFFINWASYKVAENTMASVSNGLVVAKMQEIQRLPLSTVKMS